MSGDEMLGKVSKAEWQAAYADDVKEVFSDRVVVYSDGNHVRFAFGRKGAPTSPDLLQRETAKFHVGVTVGLNALLPLIDDLVEWRRLYLQGSRTSPPDEHGPIS
ncbi:hypothetical protein [Kaistia nematophila]|uniref:Uncharacterized protein n=1 Tax=Kaistia nematophila TaxID=2994654 RepID=A0A9X3EBA1_9HYPH|nr:hypothetical protein [Kaistia nematophila]MCX5569635.1 hypothetical protein [Kaistia nematophila]